MAIDKPGDNYRVLRVDHLRARGIARGRPRSLRSRRGGGPAPIRKSARGRADAPHPAEGRHHHRHGPEGRRSCPRGLANRRQEDCCHRPRTRWRLCGRNTAAIIPTVTFGFALSGADVRERLPVGVVNPVRRPAAMPEEYQRTDLRHSEETSMRPYAWH
jgi:hypothetical protein